MGATGVPNGATDNRSGRNEGRGSPGLPPWVPNDRKRRYLFSQEQTIRVLKESWKIMSVLFPGLRKDNLLSSSWPFRDFLKRRTRKA